MGHPNQRLALGALMAVTGLASVPGCAAFRMGNPFLPAARIFVTPNPAVTSCKLTLNRTTNIITFTANNIAFTLAPNSGDITPGVLFTDYTLRYLDQSGTEINSLLIPRQRMGVSMYVPRGGGAATGGSAGAAGGAAGGSAGGGATGGSGNITIPIVQDAIANYGIKYGFRNAGTDTNRRIVQNPDPWSQNITGEITFFGQDENQYPIQASASFTINYAVTVETGTTTPGGAGG